MGNTRPILHKLFGGLSTSIADAPANTLLDCQNLVRHKHLGLLETADGYGMKFDATLDLPQVKNINFENSINPDIHQITDLAFESIHNFYVPDHGGKNISLAIAKEKLGGFYESTAKRILGITQANPAVVNVVAHSYTSGDAGIVIAGVLGMTIANSNLWTVTKIDADHFSIPVDTTGSPAYAGRGTTFYGTQSPKHNVAPTTNRMGIFARPYWDGSVWQNKWQELTEEFIFQVLDVDIPTKKMYLDSQNYFAFSSIDPNASVFNSSYFLGWVIYYKDLFAGQEVWDIVTEVGFVGQQFYIKGLGSSVPASGVPTYDGQVIKLLRYHHPIYENNGDLPYDINSQVVSLINDARITTGNTPSDVALMVGFRTKTWAFAGSDNAIDRLILAPSTMDISTGFIVGFSAIVQADSDFVPNGYYFLRLTLEWDDGNGNVNESKTLASCVIDASLHNYKILPTITIERGSLPLRSRKFKIYGAANLVEKQLVIGGTAATPIVLNVVNHGYTTGQSNIVVSGIGGLIGAIGTWTVTVVDADHFSLDGSVGSGAFNADGVTYALVTTDPQDPNYNLYTEVDIYNGESVWTGAFNPARQFNIHGTDVNNPGAEQSTETGHSTTDDGIVRYKYGEVIGKIVYLAGVQKNGIYYPNKFFSSSATGEGAISYDMFPFDGFHVGDIEYSDGDSILALGGLNDDAVAIKKRSVVLTTPLSNGGFARKLITKGYGMASAKSLISFDDKLYWLDYAGVIEFSTRGIEIVNHQWLDDLIEMDDAVKEAAIGVYDRDNHQYRLLLGLKEYVLDLLTGEWLIQKLNHTPLRYATDIDGTIDFLSTKAISNNGTPTPFYVVEKFDGSTLHDGEAFNFFGEFNEQQHEEIEDEDHDIIVKRVSTRYKSDVDLTATIYKNDSQTVLGTTTFKKENSRDRWKSTLAARCSSYRVRFDGVISVLNQKSKIIRLGKKHEVDIAGGDTSAEI